MLKLLPLLQPLFAEYETFLGEIGRADLLAAG